MTRQEAVWMGSTVWVTGILSRSGRMHYRFRKYIGQRGQVIGEAKNGMLLVDFGRHPRAIPAGCLTRDEDVRGRLRPLPRHLRSS